MSIKKFDERLYNNLVNSLQRFENSFRGVGYHPVRQEATLQFDLGRHPPRVDDFPPDVVSDGLLRAMAIATLTSMRRPPAILLVEEIDDGISQKNIGRFLGWLRQAAGTHDSSDRGYSTQIILTSHSPSVLREFSDHLNDVYHVYLLKRGYRSSVRNLGEALKTYIDLGTLPGEYDQRDPNSNVHIEKNTLVDAWYNGTLGGEVE